MVLVFVTSKNLCKYVHFRILRPLLALWPRMVYLYWILGKLWEFPAIFLDFFYGFYNRPVRKAPGGWRNRYMRHIAAVPELVRNSRCAGLFTCWLVVLVNGGFLLLTCYIFRWIYCIINIDFIDFISDSIRSYNNDEWPWLFDVIGWRWCFKRRHWFWFFRSEEKT